MEQIDVAKEQALHFLTFRPRSSTEVRQYLQRKDHPLSIQEEVVEWLQHLGYVDDLRFAMQWIENRYRTNPMGVRRLSKELWQKGIPQPIINEALERCGATVDEGALAKELATKQARRYRGQDSTVIARRLAGFLGRRGFRSDDIQRAISETLEALHLP
ncbi:MAG: regulatory protein RecX [Firmicutes bacterium]|nr:regulatory protein RecX [Bacillota bacterium]